MSLPRPDSDAFLDADSKEFEPRRRISEPGLPGEHAPHSKGPPPKPRKPPPRSRLNPSLLLHISAPPSLSQQQQQQQQQQQKQKQTLAMHYGSALNTNSFNISKVTETEEQKHVSEFLLLVQSQQQNALYSNTTSYFSEYFEVVGAPIAAGDVSEVLRVKWKQNNRLYALKRQSSSRSFIEASLSCSLRDLSDNCVTALAVWHEFGDCFILMELFSFTLSSWLKSLSPLEALSIPERWILSWIKDLSSAIEAVHSLGYSHLDIKPDNIFMRPAQDGAISGMPVLLLGDFGSALLVSEHTGQSTTGRTDERYICPERSVSFEADIYSLGVTFLDVLLDVEMPSSGIVWSEIRTCGFSAANTILAKRPNVSQLIVQLVDDMMQIMPNERPNIKEILRRASGISANKRTRSPSPLTLRLKQQQQQQQQSPSSNLSMMDCSGDCTMLYSNVSSGGGGNDDDVFDLSTAVVLEQHNNNNSNNNTNNNHHKMGNLIELRHPTLKPPQIVTSIVPKRLLFDEDEDLPQITSTTTTEQQGET